MRVSITLSMLWRRICASLAAALLFAASATMLLPKTAFAFAGGDGSAGSPYQISSAADLSSLSSYLGSGYSNTYFILTADINLNSTSWTPIGTGTTTSRFFGNIDGDGHTISNLYVSRSGSDYSGLFGSIAGTVSNLHITGGDVLGHNYNGILAGISYGTIDNCTTAGAVTGTYWRIGGLVGSNAGTVSNSSSSAVATGTLPRIGGLVGENTGLVTDSHATGAVTNTGSSANQTGGLVGVQFSGSGVVNSYATGDVAGNSSVGGLVGDSSSPVATSYATGNVTASGNPPGGLVGSSSSSITNSYARGNVTATAGWYGGGLSGSNSSSISNSYSTGLVTSIYSGGGFIGSSSSGTVASSYWDTETSGWLTSNGGTGKTTAQLKTQGTFTGWDFGTVWGIDGSATINNGYPYLQMQDVTPPNSAPNAPSNLGGSHLVDGSWSHETTPTFSFTLSDSNSGDTVQYRLQVDDTADFSTPIADYTSALGAQGAASFTIGQAAGSGTYTVGSSSQTLDDGVYYWHVQAIDNSSAASAYTPANSGNVAFRIDTTGPEAPGTPVTSSSPTTDTAPGWSWTASTDSGSGLASTPYIINWSQTADFSSGVSSDSSDTNTFAHSTPLSDGVWYVRVRASDQQGNASAWSGSGSVIIDTTAPIISILGSDIPVITQGESYTDAGATALDAIAGDLTSSVLSSGVVDTSTPGTYTITYSVTDTAGNVAHAERTVVVAAKSAAVATHLVNTASQPAADSKKTESAATVLDTPAQDVAVQSALVLNDFPEFATKQGKALDLQPTSKVLFWISRNSGQKVHEEHSITVKSVTADSATFVIASAPFTVTLTVGTAQELDVNKDGEKDIVLSLLSVVDGNAQIAVRQLSASDTITLEQDDTNGTTAYSYVALAWGIAIGFAICGSIALRIAARRRRSVK